MEEKIVLEALFDAVIILPSEDEDQNHGGIVVPDLGKEKNKTGTVVSVGPGKYTLQGVLLPPQLQVGDTVVIPTMGFTTFEYEDEELWIGPENQILGRIKKD